MKVLVLNSGSSSVKYMLFDMHGEKKLANGIIECIGLPEAYFKHQVSGGEKIKEACKVTNHMEAIELILKNLVNPRYKVLKNINEIDAVGHRIVHGGEKFSKSVMINDEVRSDIQKCFALAPLHNPHNYAGVESCEKLLPGVPQIAVFDTAFHQTIPDYAYLYGLPYTLYQKYNIRRYGFHGTSHNYVALQAAKLMGKKIEELKIITCHLGNGCSVAAIDKGISVDTSMGFTPLEGLVMGTRCGDIDPAIIIHLLSVEKTTAEDLYTLLNSKSGLFGISGLTGDMRTILKSMASGSDRARLALDVFCYRVKKYIASYMGVLNGADAIVFTAGVGENSPTVRERSCHGLDRLGITIDSNLNNDISSDNRFISPRSSAVKVLVIPTNEELMIARETAKVLTNN